MLNAYASPHNTENSCAKSDTTISRSIRSCDPDTPGESIRLAAPHTDFAKVTAARLPLLLCPSPSWLQPGVTGEPPPMPADDRVRLQDAQPMSPVRPEPRQ